MTVTENLKKFDLRTWLLVISIILLVCSIFLPLHTSYRLDTRENDKETITAYTYTVKYTHTLETHVLSEKSFPYSSVKTELGYDSQWVSYMTYLLPLLILVSILFFAYEIFRADIIERKGLFIAIGTIILLLDISLFVSAWSGVITYRYGIGFYDESRGYITVLSSQPDWGFWCIVASLILSFIAFLYARKESILSRAYA